VEYHVVVSESSLELATIVNQYLDKGWGLQGGVTACHAENDAYLNHVFAQAITRPTSGAVDGGEGAGLPASTPEANPAPEVSSQPTHHH